MHQSSLSHVTVRWVTYDRLDACEALWRAFQETANCTAFQRFEWLSAWVETIGQHEHFSPLIAVGYVGDEIKVLFPLALDRQFSARRLTWLAGGWCDYCQPIIDLDFSATLNAEDVETIWTDLCDLAGDVDYLLLARQPVRIGAFDNPFAQHDATPYTAKAYALRLGSDWTQFYEHMRSAKTRRRLREKEKGLTKAGELEFVRLREGDDIADAVVTLLDWKVAQIVARGMFNPFADKSVDTFLSRVVASSPDFARLYSMELDGEMLAGCIALVHGKTFTIFQMAYGLGPHSRHSPGQILVNNMMRTAIEEGLEIFDFSLGDEPYKLDICDIHTELTQVSRTHGVLGWLPSRLNAAKSYAKRYAKQSDRLVAATFALNRVAYRIGFKPVDREDVVLPAADTGQDTGFVDPALGPPSTLPIRKKTGTDDAA